MLKRVAATSALDSTSENAVNSAIDSIIREQNITVILAAHRLSSIARAERVIVLEDGVVSEEGRYDILVSPFGSSYQEHFHRNLADTRIRVGDQGVVSDR